jgi:nucleoside transporter
MYEATTQTGFFVCLLIYFHCFTPAAALTNKIALRHLANSDAEYPLIRIFSTVGWISAGLLVGLVWPWATGESIEAMRTPLLLGAFGSVAMAIYLLTLPNTPPEGRSDRLLSRAVHDSAELLSNRPLIAFLIISMLAVIPTMAYNNYGNLFLNHQGFPRPAALMTLGQLSDVLFLWSTPWLIQRLGLRSRFTLGVIAWAVRYGLLAFGSTHELAWPVYFAILIHGACYVFVYVVGVMYVDKLVSHTHRGTAQGMYAIVSAGIGNLLGALTVGLSQQTFLTPDGVSPPPYHWPQFWIVPAMISVATAVIFLIAFRPRPLSTA